MLKLKTKPEIDAMRESGRIAAETLRLVGATVAPGVTTRDLDAMAEEYIRSCGAEPAFKGYGDKNNPFPAALCISVDDEVVHGIPGGRVLNEGELVSLDVGVLKDGWYGDHALTYAVGAVSEEKKKLLDVTRESLQRAIDQVVVGNKLHDISHAVESYVLEHGFSVVRELCGHGLGRSLHEEPNVPNYGKKGTGIPLRDGMTMAIEPMVNVGTWQVQVQKDGWTVVTKDGKPSAHFEHTVAVVDGKAEILTR